MLVGGEFHDAFLMGLLVDTGDETTRGVDGVMTAVHLLGAAAPRGMPQSRLVHRSW